MQKPINFWTKKAWFPARYVTISVKVKKPNYWPNLT